MLSAYAVVRIFSVKHIGKFAGLILVVGLIFSGIIDFFPIANDHTIPLADMPKNADAEFFKTQTKPTDVILNSTWFYHPASLAGRKIFAGYPYFSWSYGYDQRQRERDQILMYSTQEKQSLCQLLRQFNISYIETNTHPDISPITNMELLEREFTKVYENLITGVHIYEVRSSCQK